MQALPSDTDVLIAGAGPSGLALAMELRRRGVSPTIVDRQVAGANTSRACVVHARTLEALEPTGVSQDLLARGVRVPIFRIRDRGHSLITIDFSKISSPYRFTLMIPQNRVEESLLGHLVALGGNVARPCELLRCEPQASHIQVELRGEGGMQTVKARWLVGCDGMHSRVREQSGITFAGAAYEQTFVLADVRMDWPLSREEVTLFYSPDGLVVVAPLPEDHFRIVATVDEAPESPTARDMQAVLDRRARPSSRGGSATWCGARGFASITAWPKPRARAACCCAATPPTCTARRAGRA